MCAQGRVAAPEKTGCTVSSSRASPPAHLSPVSAEHPQHASARVHRSQCAAAAADLGSAALINHLFGAEHREVVRVQRRALAHPCGARPAGATSASSEQRAA